MQTIRLTPVNKEKVIEKAIAILVKGGLIIYPTETCYGVGVDATDQEAVKKLLRYKQRPEGKAISIAVSDPLMAENYVVVNKTAENLYKNFLPGPITVISNTKRVIKGYQELSRVAGGIAAEDGSLGIRIPDYPFILELIKRFGRPITATSANMSGRKTPYSIDDILDNIPEKKKELIDLIIDVGGLPYNPPSTVVDTRLNDERILREGSVRFQYQISKIKDQKYISKIKTFTSKSEEETQQIGYKLMEELVPDLARECVIFALQGELGAGKTQFAKGVARALGITEVINSPTFVLVKEYVFNIKSQKSKMFHIDTWRMQEEKELLDLGFEKMIKPENVVVIEWIEKVRKILDEVSRREHIRTIWLMIEGEKNRREVKVVKN